MTDTSKQLLTLPLDPGMPGIIMSTPLGVDILFLLFAASVTLGFQSFHRKVFILSLPNLVWVFVGLLLVKIAV